MIVDPHQVAIGVIDVGSPKNIGWAVVVGESEDHGSELDDFILCFAEHSRGGPVARGFEAPLFLPVGRPAPNLTKQRDGEAGRP